jgi:hypothetical protein
MSLSAPDIHPRQTSPERLPAEPRAGFVRAADPLVFVGESSALGREWIAGKTWM